MTDTTIMPIRAPLFRRLWVVVLLTCLLFTFPVAMVLLFTGDIYRKKDGTWQPLKTSSRMVYGSLLALWLVALIAKQIVAPTSLKEEMANNQVVESQSRTQASNVSNSPANATTTAATCANESIIASVKSALEGSGGPLEPITVEDLGNAKTVFADQAKETLHCSAEAVLNTGRTPVAYQVYRGPSGKLLVSAQTGDKALGMQAAATRRQYYLAHPEEAAGMSEFISGVSKDEIPPQNDNTIEPLKSEDQQEQPEPSGR